MIKPLRPQNYGRPSLSTRLETVRYINDIYSSRCRRRTTQIQEIADALVAAGYISLDEQAKALGLNRSTVWTIVKSKHKLGRLNAKTTQTILANPDTPASVRVVIQQYLAQDLVTSNQLSRPPRALKIRRLIKELRSTAQECKSAARESPDKELSEYLTEVSVVLTSIASALEEYDQ